MFFARKLEGIVALAILSLLVTDAAYSQSSSKSDDPLQFELAGMGKRGGVIARAREQVLVVLQTENACTAWFREADPDPAGVFRSLHYEIEKDKPSYIFRKLGGQLLKHPWAARTTQNRGRNAIVELNAIGP